MSFDLLFTLINVSVLPAWVLLIFVPRWKGTEIVAHSILFPMLLGCFYLACLMAALAFSEVADGADMTTIAGVTALFSHPVGVLTGWTHYLVFDLFVGAWIGRDAQRRGVSHVLVVPSLILTLMFGPVGLLLYLVGRAAMGHREFSIRES